MTTTTSPKISLSLLQLAVLRQHFNAQSRPTPQEELYVLLEQLGNAKLRQAIALIPDTTQS